MIKEAIETISKGKDLAASQMKSVFNEIMSGKAGHDDIKTFLVSLADKGETVDEITAAAAVMRQKMTKIELSYDTVLDTCGTGGGMSSFNVSTIVAIVAAGAGIKVAKHGNRSYTSHCGSADILENLGVKLEIAPSRVAECIEEVGVGFLFAPLYHSAMKYVIGVRKEIKRRTIFNILGPLSNPAGANVQLIGAYGKALTEILATVLKNLKVKRAFVVYGLDGFDEVSISDETAVSEVRNGKVDSYEVNPRDFGINRYNKNEVACRNLNDNIRVFNSILDGEEGPHREMVLANASLALNAAGRAKDFKDGVKVASESIDTGKAKKILEALVRFTNKF